MANGNELVCVELYGHGHRYGQDASDMISEEMAIVVKASSSQQQGGVVIKCRYGDCGLDCELGQVVAQLGEWI